MKNPKVVLSKIAHCNRLKSFQTSAALILATLMMAVAAATTVASAQTYTDVHNFNLHGKSPSGILAQGRGGNLLGTVAGKTSFVFRITRSGKVKVLYNFDVAHGSYPSGGLTLGTDGNFYGTTPEGGGNGCARGRGCGTIFKITKDGNLTTLYRFTGYPDPYRPVAPPIQGTDGNFYGTTETGAAYKITPSGTFTLLGSLPGPSRVPLLQATDGNFYGTTVGNAFDCGTVFKMIPKGIVTIVYGFDGAAHGCDPEAPVIQGSDGNFYGTTLSGGSSRGVAYKLTPQGAITVLYNFKDYGSDDAQYPSGLVQATDGNFYGATGWGGTTSFGVIFKITPAGDFSILYNFDCAYGCVPESTPMQHTDGKIYGLTRAGGTYGSGVFYSFDLGLAPFVSLLSTTGKVGKTVEVLGQGFTGTTAVSINGTAATFTVVYDTYLKATVPIGATTGFVTVTTPGGTLTSNKQFRVKP